MTHGPPSPVVVSGLGSSGTRVVADILRGLGVDMGHDLNRASDNLLFTLLVKRPRDLPGPFLSDAMARAEDFIRVFAQLSRGSAEGRHLGVTRELLKAAQYQVRHGIERGTVARRAVWTARRLIAAWKSQRASTPEPWGFKEPTAHLFLPALRRVFPSMSYIHVMRDPRDYALVPHNQALLWAPKFPSLGGRRFDDSVSAQLHWWVETNRRAVDIAGDHRIPFFVVRLEELVEEPERVVTELGRFVGQPADRARTETLSRLVKRPTSMGRGNDLDLDQIGGPEVVEGIRQLGYAP